MPLPGVLRTAKSRHHQTLRWQSATVGSGVMVGLLVDSREKVDRVHGKALELRGKDEGAAGPRGEGFYAGYFRDLDGNKLNVFFMG